MKDGRRIGRPAHEKETYLAYLAYLALFFRKLRTHASVQSRDDSADRPRMLALAGSRRQRQESVSTIARGKGADLARLVRLIRTFLHGLSFPLLGDKGIVPKLSGPELKVASGLFGLRWFKMFRRRAGPTSGSIATAGGLVFICATDDARFRAFDARTGEAMERETWCRCTRYTIHIPRQ